MLGHHIFAPCRAAGKLFSLPLPDLPELYTENGGPVRKRSGSEQFSEQAMFGNTRVLARQVFQLAVFLATKPAKAASSQVIV